MIFSKTIKRRNKMFPDILSDEDYERIVRAIFKDI